MLHLLSLNPQQADTLKKHTFETNESTQPVQEKENAASQTRDSTSTKKHKKKKEKKKSEDGSRKSEEKKTEAKEKKTEVEKTEIGTKKSEPGTPIISNPPVPSKPQITSNSIFTGLRLKDIQQDKIHIQNREYWIPTIILFSLLVIVWARTSHNSRFSRIGKAFFNIREFYQVVREEYAMINSLSIAMVMLFVLTLSAFIYQVNSFYNVFPLSPNAFIFFVKIVIAVLLFFLAKLVLVNLLGIMFYGRSEQVSDFIYNIFLMNNVSGLALVPIVLFMAYFNVIPRSTLILISSIILSSIYLYRILRTFSISTGEGNVSRLYFFMYLCTLEFLPFVVIFKMISSRF